MTWVEIDYVRSCGNGRPLNNQVSLGKTKLTSTINFPAHLVKKEFLRVYRDGDVFRFVPSDESGIKVYGGKFRRRISRKVFFEYKKGRYQFKVTNDDLTDKGSIEVTFDKEMKP